MEWIKDISNMPKDISTIAICFDTGEWCKYDDDNWPHAIVTGWIQLPIVSQPKLTWQFSTKHDPHTWIDASNDEYEYGKNLQRFEWRQIEK